MTRKILVKWLIGAALVVCTLLGVMRCYGYEIQLYDCYFIARGGEFGGEGYYLECNPGYRNMPMIENLKSAMWNSRIIIVEQQFPGTNDPNVWWIIPASGKELMCGNDTVLGPMSASEKDTWLDVHPPAERLKRRTY